jgi:hypothetical protein
VNGVHRIEFAILENQANPVTPRTRGVSRVHAEHRHLAAVAGTIALEYLDRGGLSGAVHTEESQDLTSSDVEADSVNPLVLTVGLTKVLN